MDDVLSQSFSSVREGRRVVAALCVTSFMATLMYASLSPFFAEIGRDLGTSIPALGQVVTVRLVLSAGLAILAGPLADRYGYRRTLLVGMGGLALTFLGVSISQSYWMLLLTSIPGGVAGGTLSGIPMALAGTLFDGAERRKALSYVIAALSSSAILGVPVLTGASTAVGWRGVFFGSAVVALGAGVFIWRSLPADVVGETTGRVRIAEIVDPYRKLLGDGRMVRLYASTFLRATGWIGYLTYVGAYLNERVGFSIGVVGLVYMVSGAGYLVGSVVAGRMKERWPAPKVASGFTLVAAVMLLVSTLVPSVSAVVVAGVAGLSIASSLAWVMFTTLMSISTRAGQGATMSFNATIQNVGAATGGIMGGVMIAVSGYALMGLVLGVALAASGLLIFVNAGEFEAGR